MNETEAGSVVAKRLEFREERVGLGVNVVGSVALAESCSDRIDCCTFFALTVLQGCEPFALSVVDFLKVRENLVVCIGMPEFE